MKKQLTIISLCLAVALLCTACGKTGTQLVTDNAEPNSEVTAEQSESEITEETPTESDDGHGQSPIFLTDFYGAEGTPVEGEGRYDYIWLRTDSLEDVGSDEKLGFWRPHLNSFDDLFTFARSYTSSVTFGSLYMEEDLPEDDKLESILAKADHSLRMSIKNGLVGSYGYTELVVESQDEVTINDLNFRHFTGYLKGSNGEDDSSSFKDEYTAEKWNGLTYYAEGYTYLHTNGVAAVIVAVSHGDNEGKAGEGNFTQKNYPVLAKEAAIKNLQLMMETIKYQKE